MSWRFMCSKVNSDAPWNTEKHSIEIEERVCVFEGFSNAFS